MSANRTDFEAILEDANASAGGAGLFVEERTDLRAILTSSGHRDISETRTRGAAVPGVRSVHLTEPRFMPPTNDGSRAPAAWDPSFGERLVHSASRAGAGRRHPHWSATLVAFHQEIWVEPELGRRLNDVRRGSRLEIHVGLGSERSARAVQELVLKSDQQSAVAEAFVRAFDRAEQRFSGSVAAKPGPTAAVLAPGVAGIVAHELIGHALEGDVVLRRQTWLKDKAEPFAIAPVTVIDDPRRGRGAWSIDDEGVAVTETILVDRGRTAGRLLDRASANAFGQSSTGHGRRSSYLEAVHPRMGCTFIAAGVDTPDDILHATPTGVFIRRLVGGHTDPRVGRASFVVTDADRIVDGKLAEALDPFVMTLDGLESWRSIDRVGHDLAFDTCIGSCVRDGQPIAVSVGGPTIRIGVVRVVS